MTEKKCIGAGNCASLCPKFFKLAEDGKVDLKGFKQNKKTGDFELETKESDCVENAALSCPVRAIICR